MRIQNVIFQEKISVKINIFLVPCLKPVDLKVSLKLMEKNLSHHFSHILFMKGSYLGMYKLGKCHSS